MSAKNKNRLAKGLRWTARAFGLGVNALLLLSLLPVLVFPYQSPSRVVIPLTGAAIIITLTGWIISWWRVGLAGLLLLLASYLVSIDPIYNGHSGHSQYFVSENLDSFIFVTPLLLTGLLLLISWWLSRKTRPSTQPPSSTS